MRCDHRKKGYKLITKIPAGFDRLPMQFTSDKLESWPNDLWNQAGFLPVQKWCVLEASKKYHATLEGAPCAG